MASVLDDYNIDTGEVPESFFDKYAKPIIGNVVGGTLDSIYNSKSLGEAATKTGVGLGSLFASLPMALATHSPDAQAALLPATLAQSRQAIRALKSGLSPDKLAKTHGLVHDGRDWNKYIPDEIPLPYLQDALKTPDSSGGLLDQFIKHHTKDDRLKEMGMNLIHFDKDLPYSGQYTKYKKGYYVPGSVAINPNQSLLELKRAIRHEGQHALDASLGRSHGAHLDKGAENYLHNLGEVRARLNSALGDIYEGAPIAGKKINPTTYEGLKDLFLEGLKNDKRTFRFNKTLLNGQ